MKSQACKKYKFSAFGDVVLALPRLVRVALCFLGKGAARPPAAIHAMREEDMREWCLERRVRRFWEGVAHNPDPLQPGRARLIQVRISHPHHTTLHALRRAHQVAQVELRFRRSHVRVTAIHAVDGTALLQRRTLGRRESAALRAR